MPAVSKINVIPVVNLSITNDVGQQGFDSQNTLQG